MQLSTARPAGANRDGLQPAVRGPGGASTTGEPIAVSTIGYEGQSQTELLASLVDADVEVLVDVRLNAISRKKGLSKQALSDALEAAGIRYVHLRGLGNPKENRPEFIAGKRSAVDRFANLLRTGQGAIDMSVLRELSANHNVALLCFERDPSTCHRSVIAAELARTHA